MSSPGEEMKRAFEEVLKQFDITLDVPETSEEEKKQQRYGDYGEIISKTQEKLDDLNQKGEILLQKTGMTREELENYANNPSNFNKSQWEALEKLRKATDDFKRQASGTFSQEKEIKPVERKKKMPQDRFGKKKNWIPS